MFDENLKDTSINLWGMIYWQTSILDNYGVAPNTRVWPAGTT